METRASYLEPSDAEEANHPRVPCRQFDFLFSEVPYLGRNGWSVPTIGDYHANLEHVSDCLQATEKSGKIDF
jgi:hypothetical protein